MVISSAVEKCQIDKTDSRIFWGSLIIDTLHNMVAGMLGLLSIDVPNT